MKITVLYFASLKEALGLSREQIELPSSVTSVADLIAYLHLRGAVWKEALDTARGMRCAINQTVVEINSVLSDQAEVALFPPVTGG